jgi:hypothetical protein
MFIPQETATRTSRGRRSATSSVFDANDPRDSFSVRDESDASGGPSERTWELIRALVVAYIAEHPEVEESESNDCIKHLESA